MVMVASLKPLVPLEYILHGAVETDTACDIMTPFNSRCVYPVVVLTEIAEFKVKACFFIYPLFFTNIFVLQSKINIRKTTTKQQRNIRSASRRAKAFTKQQK